MNSPSFNRTTFSPFVYKPVVIIPSKVINNLDSVGQIANYILRSIVETACLIKAVIVVKIRFLQASKNQCYFKPVPMIAYTG